MQNLGDFFSAEMRAQLAQLNLKVGAVLKYNVDFTIPPKVKRLIIVGFDNQNILFACVLINTEINPNIFSSPYLKSQNTS